jgi:hypothetical protein
MKGVIRVNGGVCFTLVVILTSGICAAVAQPASGIKLNQNAFTFAAELIRQGHFIADHKGAWREHKPSPEVENEFIRERGLAEYAKWHLGVDDRYAVNTKGRYKFPYGDFSNVHRCGLLAVKVRAQQYGYAEIGNAAAELEHKLESKPNASHSAANHELNNSKRRPTTAAIIRQIAKF